MADNERLIFTINPGGTSTKVGLFRETELVFEKNIRHLPVLDEGKLVGVLSMRDVVKVQVKSLAAEVRYMKDFLVAGGDAQNVLSDML